MNKIIRKLNSIKKFFSRNTIYIYQMGKVGSSSIEYGLEKLGNNVIHFHKMLTPYSPKLRLRLINRFLILLFGLIRLIALRLPSKKPKKIITLVREPISRNISDFFHSFHIYLYEYMIGNTRKKESSIEMMKKVFETQVDQYIPLTWFDKEIKKYLGIDIYEYKFPKEKGWDIIFKNNFELLIIRTENLNACEGIIKQFLQLKDFKIEKSNLGVEKWYSDLYEKFKSNFKPSDEYLDLMYKNKFVKHFYTIEELKSFEDNWLA